LNRDRRRAAEEELYQSMMLDPTRSDEAKMEAEASLTHVSRTSALEDRVESILIGRDYNDVIFSVEENMSLLMIRKETIDEKEKASLIDFVSSYGGIPAETISVFSVH
ncbi:MAG: SpoIIIAH-like family protein, partial [Firmicutes bacterium]|nr:SpoIIIAH-like family protein [Bacillota bacterium]